MGYKFLVFVPGKSFLQIMGHPAKDTPTKREKFERTWPLVRDELLNHFKGQEMPRDAIEWYGKVGANDLITRIPET